MKALFIHDHIFELDNQHRAHSPGKLSRGSFDRYLEVFDSISILSRFISVESASNGSNLISGNGIDFYPFDDQSNFRNRFLNRSQYRKQIERIVVNFDAIIIRVPSEIGFLCAEVCASLNKAYVCEVVACPSDAMDSFNGLKSLIYKPVIVKAMKNTVSRAFSSLYVTDHFLQSRYPCKRSSIASNVDISSTAIGKKCWEDKDSYRLVLVGNLDSEHKGYDTLFDCLGLLDEKISTRLEVVLPGSGNKYRADTDYPNIEVIYPGVLTKQEIVSLLDSCDLYLQPSTQEGLPRATIEAMSRALPCVVSSCGGLPELVDSSLVHPMNSPVQMADIIARVLIDEKLYTQQSEVNLERSKKYLSDNLSKVRFEFFSDYKSMLTS